MRKLPVLLLCLLALASPSSVAACSGPLPGSVRLTCPDGTLAPNTQFLNLSAACQDDLADLQAIFGLAVEDWQQAPPAIARSDLFITPATPERKAELLRRHQSYLQCTSIRFYQNGRWLFHTEYQPEYCYVFRVPPGGCHDRVSYTRFLFFLLSHPDRSTLPYLLPYLAVFLPLLVTFGYALKRKEMTQLLVPNPVSLTVMIVGTILFVCMAIADFPSLLLISYLCGCALRYWMSPPAPPPMSLSTCSSIEHECPGRCTFCRSAILAIDASLKTDTDPAPRPI